MYIKRIAEKQLKYYLSGISVVLISGPKSSGKTFLASLFAKSSIEITDEVIQNYRNLGKEVITNGEIPRLIDEWQWLPQIWDMVRFDVDKRSLEEKMGAFILTGSSRPPSPDKIFHSGAGRILELKIQTLTFYELLQDKIENFISLEDLFNNQPFVEFIANPISLEAIDMMMIYGGWPLVVVNDYKNYQLYIDSYINSIINPKSNDLKQYHFRIQNRTLRLVLKSIARLSGGVINKLKIIEDCKEEISRNSLDKYIDMLYDMSLLFDVPVWKNANIRSTYRFKTKPKTYLCDPSLVCKLLDIHNYDDFFKDGKTTGIIFETQVMKDLMVYAQAIGGQLYYYHDEKDNEIDAIIELADGKWCAIEIKLSLNAAINACPQLIKNIERLKMEGKYSEPLFKMVITNADQTYITKSGVFIVPHTLLKP